MVIRVNSDKLRQDAEQRGGIGWKPKNGPNYIRVLFHKSAIVLGNEDPDDFCYKFNSHFINIEGEDPLVGRCPRDKRDEGERASCAACRSSKHYKDSADPVVVEAAKDIKSNFRAMMNIIDLQNPNAGIQVFEAGWMVYKQIREYLMTDAWSHLLDVEYGHNVTLNKTPGNQTRSGFIEYSVTPDPTPSDIRQYLPQGWEQQLDAAYAAIPEYLSNNDIESALEKIGMTVDGDSAGATAAPTGAGGTTPPPVAPPVGVVPPAAAPQAPPTLSPPQQPGAPMTPPPMAPPAPPSAGSPVPPAPPTTGQPPAPPASPGAAGPQ